MQDNTSPRLEKLEAQKQKLLKQISREKAKLRGQERKDDTRRKIVAGAIALAHCERDENFNELFRNLLARFVERESDRALLGLPPSQKSANDPKKQFNAEKRRG